MPAMGEMFGAELVTQADLAQPYFQCYRLGAGGLLEVDPASSAPALQRHWAILTGTVRARSQLCADSDETASCLAATKGP
jgi:hypothetical protein